MGGITWLDIAFIGTLCAAAVLGFWSGLMWQLYGLFCLVISYFTAVLLHGLVSRPFEEGLGPGTARIVGHAIVFGAVFITSYSLGLLIKRLLGLSPGIIGRILGSVLGLLQAAVICGVVAVGLVDYSSGNLKQMAESSRVVMAFARGAHFLTVIIPSDIKEGFKGVKEKSEEVIESAKEKIEGTKEHTQEGK
ncbi:MAG: CvpA family protein [Candidatus Brocadiales bacterium]